MLQRHSRLVALVLLAIALMAHTLEAGTPPPPPPETCPKLTQLIIDGGAKMGSQTITLPGGGVDADTTPPHDGDCEYTFEATFAIKCPHTSMDFQATQATFTVKAQHGTPNAITSVEIEWEGNTLENKIGLVPCKVTKLTVSATGGAVGHASVTSANAEFRITGEVTGAKWGPFKEIETTNYSTCEEIGEINLVEQTLDTTRLGQYNIGEGTPYYTVKAKVGTYQLPEGSIVRGNGHLQVTQANKVSGIEVDPIKCANKIWVDDFWCNLRLDLFRKKLAGIESQDANLHMKLTAQIRTKQGDKLLAETVLDSFDVNTQQDEDPWVNTNAESFDWKVFKISPASVAGNFRFDAETWSGSFTNGFTVGVQAMLHLASKDVAKGTLGLNEDGTATVTVELLDPKPSLTVSSFELKTTVIGMTASADVMGDEFLTLEAPSGEIFINFDMVLSNTFVYAPGKDDGIIEGKLVFDSEGAFTMEIVSNALNIKCPTKQKKIELSNIEFTVTITTSPFAISLIKLKADASAGKALFPNADAGKTDVSIADLTISDGKLQSFSGSGKLKVGGFLFTVHEASYSETTGDGQFALDCSIAVTKSGSDVFSARGDFNYLVSDGLQDISLVTSVNLKPTTAVEGEGSITFGDGSSWTVEASATIEVKKLGSLAFEGTFGYDDGSDPYAYIFVAFAAQAGTGIPLGNTGVSLKGLDCVAAYKMKVTLGSLGGITPTPSGIPVSYDKTKDPTAYALGGGATFEPTGGGSVIQMRGGLLFTLSGSDGYTATIMANFWLLEGYVYGGGNLTWNSEQGGIDVNCSVASYLPKDEGPTRGQYLQFSATGSGKIGSAFNADGSRGGSNFGWDASATCQAIVLKEITFNGTHKLNYTGSGSSNSTVTYAKSVSGISGRKDVSSSIWVEWSNVAYTLDIKGGVTANLSNWTVTDFSGTVGVYASGTGTLSATVDTWFGDVTLGTSGVITLGTGTGDSQRCSLGFSYTTTPTRKIRVNGTGTGQVRFYAAGDWWPSESGFYSYSGSFDQELPLPW